MRRFKMIFAAILMCGLFVGCGGMASKDTTATTTIDTSETETTEQATATQAEEATEEQATEEQPMIDYTGKTTLIYIGHAGVKIVSKSGTVIYIDPAYQYKDDDYADAADVVCVTHGHDDHLPGDFVVQKP